MTSKALLSPPSSSSPPSSLSASPVSPPEAPPTDRHRCWECQRRRLVCDAVRPVCNKCRAAHIVCPGYDDKKPLTWLAPGKVTCRQPRRKSDKTKASSPKKTIKDRKPKPKQKPELAEKPKKGSDGAEVVFHAPLRTDVCDVYDAVQYCKLPDNIVFFPYTSLGHRTSVSNVFVEAVPMKIVRYIPTAIAHNLVSVVFQHRVCAQTSWKIDCPSIKHAQARLHHHRGIAIRALNEDIKNEKTQSSDIVLTGVIMLLNSEIQSCLSPYWRHHVNGLLAMLKCRGGAAGWVKSMAPMKGILLSFLISATMANTTSPAYDHVRIAPHEELMDLARDIYPLGLHPSNPIPMPLFLEIIRINNIRDQVSNGWMDKPSARAAAEDIIRQIEAFDAKEHSREGFYEDIAYNELLGLMFQSATAVFCVAALQSVSALPANSHRLTVMRTAHSNRLYFLLEESRKHPVFQKSLQWPLLVAGVEAGLRVDKRRAVGEHYVRQSTDVGTPLPMHAMGVLRTFWDGERTDWDACFDKPYAFVS
ncbi:hypothetical protein CMUS01_03869 [Colletotrichum musicola]|uniref:Zn(2)-C6 fungal-type domain-containing protein n=1 Tax=Colletotrichum musicola TaxID=2175873 RepID=A0A8H6U4B7_9PEZI|nr:hypothetical protein CMUS01_03869 [Colletotrichum musicola]